MAQHFELLHVLWTPQVKSHCYAGREGHLEGQDANFDKVVDAVRNEDCNCNEVLQGNIRTSVPVHTHL